MNYASLKTDKERLVIMKVDEMTPLNNSSAFLDFLVINVGEISF